MNRDSLQELLERRRAKPDDEKSKKPLNPRELFYEPFFLPFLVKYIDGLPHNLTFMASPEMDAAFLEAGIEVKADGSFDLSKLEPDHYLLVRFWFAE